MAGVLIAQLVTLGVLLGISGFCSCSETVFFSQDPLKVRRFTQAHPALGARLHGLLAQPTRLLSTILILNTVVNVAVSALGYMIAVALLPSWAEPAAIAAMTVLLLIFGEYGPKHVGLLFTRQLTVLFTPVMAVLVVLVTPLRWALDRITRQFEPLFRVRGGGLSGEEFATVIEISSQEGIIDAEELSLIKAVIGLEKMRVSDVMTPRVDVRGLDLNGDGTDQVAFARQSHVHYLLLYRERFDDVEGFLDVRRFLLDPAHRIEAARLPPLFVPETMSLSRLLSQFQKERRRVAVVVDEYGGTSGLVTRGDVLERISGEVYHELSRPRPVFQDAGPNRWLVDAGFSIEELNRKLHLNLEAEGVDRLSGWITFHADHLPAPNEIVEAQGCRATVLKVGKNRVELAQIEKLAEGGET